jgi:hypothetical protein
LMWSFLGCGMGPKIEVEVDTTWNFNARADVCTTAACPAIAGAGVLWTADRVAFLDHPIYL